MAVQNSPQPPDMPQRWQARFAFFDANGAPNSPAYRTAYRSLTFGRRIRIGSNFPAFFFGPFYFFFHRMWKKGTTLLGAGLLVGIVMVAANLPDLVVRLVGFAFASLAMSTANYAYYLKRARGTEGWNPFEGMGKKQ